MVPHFPAACGRRVRPARLATVPAAVQRPVASAGVGATLLAGALGHVLGGFVSHLLANRWLINNG